MSLIYKHHLILPNFKWKETITGLDRDQSDIKKKPLKVGPSQRCHTEKKLTTHHTQNMSKVETTIIMAETPRQAKPKLPYVSARNSNKSEDGNLQEYLSHLNEIRKKN